MNSVQISGLYGEVARNWQERIHERKIRIREYARRLEFLAVSSRVEAAHIKESLNYPKATYRKSNTSSWGSQSTLSSGFSYVTMTISGFVAST